MSTQDRVTLSVKERQQLADLQSMLQSADPQLAKLLAGRSRSSAQATRRVVAATRRVTAALAARVWVGPVLGVVGLALVMVALPFVVWLCIPAALIAAAGLALSLASVQAYMAARPPKMPVPPVRPGDDVAPW